MPPLLRSSLSYAFALAAGIVVGSQWQEARPQMPVAAVAPAKTAVKIKALTPAPEPALRPPPAAVSIVPKWMDWIEHADRLGQSDAVFAAVSALPDMGLRIALIRQLADDRPRYPWLAGRLILGLPQNEESMRLMSRLLSFWGRYDAEEELTFMETLPPEWRNSIILFDASSGLGALPAERLKPFVDSLNAAGREHFISGYARAALDHGTWASTLHALDVLGFGLRFTDDLHRPLIMRMADAAPTLLEHCLATATDADARDGIIPGYSAALHDNDPAQALCLTAQISNEERRAESIDSRLRRWLGTNRAKALAWLQSHEARTLIAVDVRAKWLRHYGLEARP